MEPVDGTLSRQKIRSDLSTRRMLDAAGDLIVEGGYFTMTLAAVGERAGYSRGLATSRFGSKDKLLEALVDRITRVWHYRNVLPRTEGRQARGQIIGFLEAVRDQAKEDERGLKVLYALMFEALGPIPELRQHFANFHKEMRDDLAELVRAGRVDGSIPAHVDPEREAELVVAGLRGIAYQWALDAARFDCVAALTYLVEVTDRRLT